MHLIGWGGREKRSCRETQEDPSKKILAWKWMCHPFNICWGTWRYIAIRVFLPACCERVWTSVKETGAECVRASADQTTPLIYCQGQWQSSCETRAIILSTFAHAPWHPVSARALSQRGWIIFTGGVAFPHLTTEEFGSFLQKVATQIHLSSI